MIRKSNCCAFTVVKGIEVDGMCLLTHYKCGKCGAKLAFLQTHMQTEDGYTSYKVENELRDRIRDLEKQLAVVAK